MLQKLSAFPGVPGPVVVIVMDGYGIPKTDAGSAIETVDMATPASGSIEIGLNGQYLAGAVDALERLRNSSTGGERSRLRSVPTEPDSDPR